jgi:hypothetical protein
MQLSISPIFSHFPRGAKFLETSGQFWVQHYVQTSIWTSSRPGLTRSLPQPWMKKERKIWRIRTPLELARQRVSSVFGFLRTNETMKKSGLWRHGRNVPRGSPIIFGPFPERFRYKKVFGRFSFGVSLLAPIVPFRNCSEGPRGPQGQFPSVFRHTLNISCTYFSKLPLKRNVVAPYPKSWNNEGYLVCLCPRPFWDGTGTGSDPTFHLDIVRSGSYCVKFKSSVISHLCFWRHRIFTKYLRSYLKGVPGS